MKGRIMYLIAVFAIVAIAAMTIPSLGVCATDATSTLCSNPIKDTIEQTASINEMRAVPAPSLSYVLDALGNKVPNQTENSGKQCLGT